VIEAETNCMNSQIGSETTGSSDERMIPESASDDVVWAHLHRYRFAVSRAKGRRVLDIACGEGYGSAALMAAGAASVIGIDINFATVVHAHDKYGLKACVGDAAAIPLGDQSLDLIVSFETLEHVPNPGKFISECHRLLAPGGSLIISTPNRPVFQRIYHHNGSHNEFHCSEVTQEEFVSLLKPYFERVEIFGQQPTTPPFGSAAWLAGHRRAWRRLGRYLFRRNDRLSASRIVRAMSRLAVGIDVHLPAVRENPIRATLESTRLFGRVFDPFAVRLLVKHRQENSVYLVAVAYRGKADINPAP
jgi:SAM-dependent methyltransferase